MKKNTPDTSLLNCPLKFWGLFFERLCVDLLHLELRRPQSSSAKLLKLSLYCIETLSVCQTVNCNTLKHPQWHKQWTVLHWNRKALLSQPAKIWAFLRGDNLWHRWTQETQEIVGHIIGDTRARERSEHPRPQYRLHFHSLAWSGRLMLWH